MRYLPVLGVTTHDLANTHGAPRSGGRTHKGIDIFADEGTGVVAVTSGKVVKAGDSGGLGGLRVWVQGDDGMFHYYAHLSAVDVKAGDTVKAGRRLGAVGKTGNAQTTPPHLHYSVNPKGTGSEAGALPAYDYLLGANTAPKDSTEAMAQRFIENPEANPLPNPEPPRELSVDARKSNLAGIMASVSQAARHANDGTGKALDVRALFGGVFDESEVA